MSRTSKAQATVSNPIIKIVTNEGTRVFGQYQNYVSYNQLETAVKNALEWDERNPFKLGYRKTHDKEKNFEKYIVENQSQYDYIVKINKKKGKSTMK